MSWFSRLFGRSAVEVAVNPPVEAASVVGITSPDPGVPFLSSQVEDIEVLWKSQPNLRKVVSFAARNIASIPLRVYRREADDSRVRVRDNPLARLLEQPSGSVGATRFWYGVLTEALLWDKWALLVGQDSEGNPTLTHIPAWRLSLKVDGLNQLVSAKYIMDSPGAGVQEYTPIDLDRAIVWYGYAPNGAGSPMVNTLIDVLAEGAEAVQYRRQIWENGARVPQWISRPLEAPKWSDAAKRKWGRGFRSAYSGTGAKAGGVPVLEDGMQLNGSESFSPKVTEDLEGRRLSAVEVASAFHIAPELVGVREGTFASVDAYRQMLYRESLGPYIDDWVQALNAQLLPMVTDEKGLYIEPHLDAKLRGSFLEEAQMITTSTGAPWMSVDEARTIQNMPKLDDDYAKPVRPLNLVYGGQMPSLAGLQNVRKGQKSKDGEVLRVKANVSEEDAAFAAGVLAKFFDRQGKSVLSQLGSDTDDWWDAERWDRELADDLYRVARDVSGRVGADTAVVLGMPSNSYDEARTLKFLWAVAESRAHMINEATHRQLVAALRDDLEEDAEKATPEGVFEEATHSRAAESGVTFATTVTTFAVVEMGKQVSRDGVTKTWVTTSGNPRPSHAAMDGETVGIDDVFSNGMEWPGDMAGAGGDAGEIANCSCVVEITIP